MDRTKPLKFRLKHRKSIDQTQMNISYKCGECGFNFGAKKDLQKHLSKHREENSLILESSLPKLSNCEAKVYECDICDRIFSEKVYLKLHTRIHKGFKPYKCPDCDGRYNDCIELQDHRKLHAYVEKTKTSTKPVKEKKTSTSEVVKIKPTNENEMKYKCKCGRRYSNLVKYKSHVLAHKDHPTDLKCYLCEATFSRRRALQLHLNEHAKEDHTEVYKCDKCDQRYFSKWWFDKHNCTNVESKCPECGKTFKDKFRLRNHMIFHSNKKPFLCQVCKKSFHLKHQLIVHERIHTGERPLSCNLCGKSFNQLNVLNRHVLNIHTNHRSKKCPLCDKGFNSADQLKSHMIVHNPEPVLCAFCGKCFKAVVHLKNHVKRCRLNPNQNTKSLITSIE
ncbi:Hypothetical predicted protein [Mytilus galloprovincialis]|uniref:C2H2-type domain-containing protein n=1 Tax=Mytilus galloprovincialis TaxID=29158 RepID=A0A8B6ESA1_MYTGA|nr:Hypothetical predicted protein [Mytilus galloprovincialis]